MRCRIAPMLGRLTLGLFSSALITLASTQAFAQWPQPAPPGPTTYNYNYYGQPQPAYYGYTPGSSSKPKSSALEIGMLYVTATTYGVGTGIWVDAEAEIEDPGIRFIPPVVLGLAAPLVVFLTDSPPMPRGMPSAISVGMLIGAGEGLGITALQYVTADKENEWTFKGFARSEVIGGLLGGAGGYLASRYLRVTPQSNLFVFSSAVWGTAIGNFIGGGISEGQWGQANDTVGIGGMIGFNAGVLAGIGTSVVWEPSWNQLLWLWLGFGIGTAASLPVYIFYAGSDKDPRGGLIFQGVAAALGVGVGAFIGDPEKGGHGYEEVVEKPSFARVLGVSPMALDHGLGVQVAGDLW